MTDPEETNTARPIIKIEPVLAPLRVSRPSIVHYMGVYWAVFYCLSGGDVVHVTSSIKDLTYKGRFASESESRHRTLYR